MSRRLPFQEAYPLGARAVLHAPLAYRAGLFPGEELPWPGLDGLRDFARFAGVGDGALRTALSRAKAEASILAESDAEGRTRYRLSPATFAMGAAQTHAATRPEGFLLAVYSFETEEGEGRAALRALLKSYGFRKLAQNAYVHGRIPTEGLQAAVRGQGLEEHLFLFPCAELEDEGLVRRILDIFGVEGRARELREYLERLEAFLPEGLGGEEAARRLLYAGAVHWELVEAREPPMPRRHLPPGYAFAPIQDFFGGRIQAWLPALREYFRSVND